MDNVVSALLSEIKKRNPDLVQRLLDKWTRDGQTIYGDLNDWMKDCYSNLDAWARDEAVKHLIADYVIKHPYCLQKVFVVVQESNDDGEILFDCKVCRDKETAKRVLKAKKDFILNENGHFSKGEEEDFEVETTDSSFYINDPSDDYYEDIQIWEENIK